MKLALALAVLAGVTLGAWREQQSLEGEFEQPVNKYVIVSMHRSGSTWLSSIMGSHPQIDTFYEIIYVKRLRHVAMTKVQNEHITSFLNSTTDDMPIDEFWHPRYEEFLDIMFEKPADENIKATGFKSLLGQGSEADKAVDYFNKNNVRVIVLLRENALRRAISSWHQNCGSDELYNVKNEDDLKKMGGAADVPATFIAAQMRKFNSLKKQLLSIHARVNNSLLLKYEELAAAPNMFLDTIQDFVGVDRMTDQMSVGLFKKLHEGPIGELVSDWDTKKKQIRANTIYGDMIDELEQMGQMASELLKGNMEKDESGDIIIADEKSPSMLLEVKSKDGYCEPKNWPKPENF
eukprot:jgi/Bigna1/60681/fgenesh1_kg.14_\